MFGSVLCEDVPMLDALWPQSDAEKRNASEPQQYLLWIDGVGTYLMCPSDRVTIGGPQGGSSDSGPADVSLLAHLSGRHASVIRSGDGYLLEAHAPTRLCGRDVLDRCCLCDGDEVQLGESVKLRFRLPNALSASARLEFVSSHRPTRSTDGVVLMDETCLLGPGGENHVPCPSWTDSVLIFHKKNELWCKSRLDLFVGDRHIRGGWRLNSGDIVTGPDLRFHLEAVKPPATDGSP
jgi:hypothetical protein